MKRYPPIPQIESPIKSAVREVTDVASCCGQKLLSVGDLQRMNAPILSEMNIIQVGQTSPEYGWHFIENTIILEGWEVAPEQHPGDYLNAEPDDYYYHVTTKNAAPKILKNGLKPGKPALFTNYSARTKGRVFLADKDGVDFWMEHVELHLFTKKEYNKDEDPRNDIVVLRIPKKEVTAKLKVDKEGTDDSRANAWYATQLIEDTGGSIFTTLNRITEAKQRPGGWIGPVYHGSRSKFLKALDIEQHGQGVVMVSGRHKTPAIYFTSSKENARYYADPKGDEDHDEYVYVAYVKMKNPMVVDEKHPLRKKHSPPQIATKAKEAGHDGFIIPDYTDGSVPSTIYGVFDNENVKLVGPLQEPKANLGTDSKINEDDIEIYGDGGEYYVYFQDADENIIHGPGPFQSEKEAEKEALRLVKRHNASLTQ